MLVGHFLSTENLKKSCSCVQVKHRAVEMAKALEHEDGATGAVNAFHKHYPRNRLLETYHDSDHSPPRSRALSFMQCFGCS